MRWQITRWQRRGSAVDTMDYRGRESIRPSVCLSVVFADAQTLPLILCDADVRRSICLIVLLPIVILSFFI